MPDIHDIFSSLRYQILTPVVTTMGKCANDDCDNYARGSGECQWCLIYRLTELTEDAKRSIDYAVALKAAQRYLFDAEEIQQVLVEKQGDR